MLLFESMLFICAESARLGLLCMSLVLCEFCSSCALTTGGFVLVQLITHIYVRFTAVFAVDSVGVQAENDQGKGL